MPDNTETTGTPITQQAKQQAQQVVHQGQHLAGQAWDMARKQFHAQLNSQKKHAATGISDISKLIRQSGQQLEGGGSRYAATIADRLDHVAANVHDQEVEEIIADTEDFARRRPALFLSIAAMLGFVLVRFLKSSQQSAHTAA